MSINVRGLSTLQAQLRSISAEMAGKALQGAARASFKRVKDTARALAPRDTGALASAINIGTAKGPGDSVAIVGLVVASNSTDMKQATLAAAAFGESQSTRLPPARRWHFAELGTARQAPHPFLRPALDQNAQAVVDDLKPQLNKKIAAAIKKHGGGGESSGGF